MVRLLLLSFGLIAFGCSQTSTERPCDPTRGGAGCPAGRACAVDASGVVACVVPAGEPVEGALCESPEGCGVGYGCVRLMGLARCLRFCDPGLTEEPCGAADAKLRGAHALWSRARCVAVFEASPDIGVCVLPCHPAAPEGRDCPMGVGCAGLQELGLSTCAPAGAGAVGEECGAAGGCAPGSLCAPEPDGVRRCRLAADEDGTCAEGEPEVLQGLYDRVRWDPASEGERPELAICR